MINGYKIVALCLAKVQDEFCFELVKNLNEQLIAKGYRLFVFSTNNDMFWNISSEKGEKAVFEIMDFSWIDLVIYYDETMKSDMVYESIMNRAMASGCPMIVFDGHRKNCININFDYIGGFEQMVRHVIEVHKPARVHYMSGIKGNAFSDEREGVFRKVMEENGRRVSEKDISYGGFWADPTRRAMQELIKRDEPLPDAIICANDAMGLEVIVRLTEAGYKVPDDVIVTGFDGIEEIYYSRPQLSSCLCDFEQVAKLMIDLYEDPREYIDKCGEYKVVPRLMLAESCGCGKATNKSITEHVFELNQMLTVYQNENRVLMEIGARIQTSSGLAPIIRELKNKYMTDMTVILKKECLDDSINPLEIRKGEVYGQELVALLDSNEPDRTEPINIRKDQIIPNLRAMLEMKMPLIFTSVHFLSVPMGYLCFYYKDYDKTNYNRIFMITSILDNAFGGFRTVRYQHYLQKQVEDSFRLDSLTGLLNRTGFFREFDILLKSMAVNGGTLSMAVVDLDNLKAINDNFGHSEGDRAICAVASALKKACPGAICCRFGGDEMIAVTDGPMDYRVVSGRLDIYLDDVNARGDTPVPYSASIGIYAVDELSKMNFDDMLKVADARMYEAKREKKKRRGEI